LRLRGRVTIGGAGLAAIAVFALLASGCGYGGVESASSHADLTNGQKLFSGAGQCAGCHTLQAAGASGTIGPNLDNAFAGSRDKNVQALGYSESTIENAVLDQIRLGSGPTPPLATYTTEKDFTTKKCLDPATKDKCYGTMMPANLVRGQDALDVAAYVASVAGTSGYASSGPTTSTDGPTLKAAGSTGTIGPNLDQLASSLTLAIVTKQVEQGGGAMPAFKGKLSAAQIKAVAQYVVSNAGK